MRERALDELCRELGVPVALLTSSVGRRARAEATTAQILVGTHALIQEGVELEELAVAVVDEQHRFGVEQRKALVEGRSPHVLHMTATPIPRTLALTAYGDLDVTVLRQLPAGRRPIHTHVCATEAERARARRPRRWPRSPPAARTCSSRRR